MEKNLTSSTQHGRWGGKKNRWENSHLREIVFRLVLGFLKLKPKHALYVNTMSHGVESEWGRTDMYIGLGQHSGKILAESLLHLALMQESMLICSFRFTGGRTVDVPGALLLGVLSAVTLTPWPPLFAPKTDQQMLSLWKRSVWGGTGIWVL